MTKQLLKKLKKRLGKKRIRQIQHRLNRFGASLSVDGIYGNNLSRAVQHYQQAHGLVPDGIYGRATRASMFGGRSRKPKRKLSTYKPRNKECKAMFPNEMDTKAMNAFYGKPTKSGTNIRVYQTPYTLKYADFTVNRISLNSACAANFLNFFQQILDYYGMDEIKRLGLDMYGGSFNYRKKRGGRRLSTHSYGCAIDLNHIHNQLRWNRKKALFAKKEYEPMIRIAEANGLYSLGYNRGYDYMHLQACWR